MFFILKIDNACNGIVSDDGRVSGVIGFVARVGGEKCPCSGWCVTGTGSRRIVLRFRPCLLFLSFSGERGWSSGSSRKERVDGGSGETAFTSVSKVC